MTVINDLENSGDFLDQDVAITLKIFQLEKKKAGLKPNLGRIPRAIRQLGTIEAISQRVLKQASGFNIIPREHSFEHLVLKHSHRFPTKVVYIAKERLGSFIDSTPTSDIDQYYEISAELSKSAENEPYTGIAAPERVQVISFGFKRSPRVGASVLLRANGVCESCGKEAPFQSKQGIGFLEVHHMKPLSEGGSDTVQNAIAVCPNCHRALHYSSNVIERSETIYNSLSVLIKE